MTRAALAGVLAAALPACGSMARDVIVEKDAPETGVVVIVVDDAGVWPVTAEDAAAPSGSSSPASCEHDGGCGPVHHCEPTECTPVCFAGCNGSNDNHRDHKRTMTWHAGYP
jgi:hypothetical protein